MRFITLFIRESKKDEEQINRIFSSVDLGININRMW